MVPLKSPVASEGAVGGERDRTPSVRRFAEPRDQAAAASVADLGARRSPPRGGEQPAIAAEGQRRGLARPRKTRRPTARRRTSHTCVSPRLMSVVRAPASRLPSGENASAWRCRPQAAAARRRRAACGASQSVTRPRSPVTASSRPLGLIVDRGGVAAQGAQTAQPLERRVHPRRTTVPSASRHGEPCAPSAADREPRRLWVVGGTNGAPASNGRSSRRSPARSQAITRASCAARVERAPVRRHVESRGRVAVARQPLACLRRAATSQTITSPSSPASPACVPSGVNRTRRTGRVWRPRHGRLRPERRSSRRTSPSSELSAYIRPSALTAAHVASHGPALS